MPESRDRPRRVEGRIEWRGRQTYRVRVHNGHDPVTGKRRYLYATGKGNQRAAEKALRDLLTQRDSGLETQPERLTVADWLDRWMAERIADGAYAPRVEANYLGNQITPRIGHVRLQELRTDHVADLKAELLTEGAMPRQRARPGVAAAEPQGLAPATVKKILALLTLAARPR